jgi:hypothetical protein
MLGKVSAAVRSELTQIRALALTEGADAALAKVGEVVRTVGPAAYDRVAIALIESEINFLNYRPEAALDVFTHVIDPSLSELDPGVASVIGDNKSSILLLTMDQSAADHFHHLADQRRILGVELTEHAANRDAAADAARGKHFDALPAYREQLKAAYESQNWRAMAWAERDLAEESLRLGWLREAAYHAMLSRDRQAIEAVANGLLAARSLASIEETLDQIISTSSLEAHAVQTLCLLRAIADAVPESRLERVVSYVVRWSSFVPRAWYQLGLLEEEWRTVEALSVRLDAATTSAIVTQATDDRLLSNSGVARRHIIRATNSLCPKLDETQLTTVLDLAISLATQQKSDIDYVESVNLLIHAAERGGEPLKQLARSRLFPPGAAISDAIMLQAAHVLGRPTEHPELFSKNTLVVAAAIKQQVQHLAPGEEPAKLGGYGTIAGRTEQGHIVVHIGGAEHWVHALSRYRGLLDDQAVIALIDAMLEMVTNDQNIVANRVGLITAISEFSDRIPVGEVGRIVAALEPIARGEIVESPVGQSHAEATNPLNPFKMGTGNPLDLRGVALITLAEFDKAFPELLPAFHSGLLLSAIISPTAELRKYGLVAAANSGPLTAAERATVALAGLDGDSGVAQLALAALRRVAQETELDVVMWHIVIRCGEAAVLSADTAHRAAAAQLMKSLGEISSPPELRDRYVAVTSQLQNDICHSVRTYLD